MQKVDHMTALDLVLQHADQRCESSRVISGLGRGHFPGGKRIYRRDREGELLFHVAHQRSELATVPQQDELLYRLLGSIRLRHHEQRALDLGCQPGQMRHLFFPMWQANRATVNDARLGHDRQIEMLSGRTNQQADGRHTIVVTGGK